ncbi:MAG: VacB/RNase II family 3'-5' exoribonuclease [Bryobacteraceae bacterium]|nr:VacB/RNase II family 3'-5' exoribonuclease [Bryobacteraceae bacterium]
MERDILDRLERAPHGRAGYKQLVRELGARGAARRDIETALDALARKGRIIELRGGQYVLASRSREYAVGRLNMHRDGYGFVVPEVPPPGLKGDIFIPPGAAGWVMHGDRVMARITHSAPGGRAEGEIVKVLERAHPTVVGEFRCGRHSNYVVPRESRIRQAILIPEGFELPRQAPSPDRIGAPAARYDSARGLDGAIVNVEIVGYPEDGGEITGRVIEILGREGDFGLDVEIVIRKHHLPHRFPAEVLQEAEAISPIIPAAEISARRDFRNLPCVTIDGETARDFDDAVWLDELSNGHFLLHVHIADVSHYVRPDSAIDREAFKRGTSVYFPDRAVPMLPLELSTGICSLLPQTDRLVLSALLEFDRSGDVVAQDFCRGVIRRAERMTYTSVHLILQGDPLLRERYAALARMFERMRDLALILNRRRMKRGSIDFDLPEPLIEFDEEGLMTGIRRAPRNIAHRIIEEFMLAANEAVSRHLETHLEQSIFRIHERPDPARVLEFEEIAARFGYSLGFGAFPVKRFPAVERRRDGRRERKDIVRADERVQVSSKMYQKLVEKLAGKPEERILNYLMLRSLKQARYSAVNEGHFALAAQSYTHFTSPIRRYPDLIVHRLLSGLLDSRPSSPGDLEGIAAFCSETERRAAEAERELVETKKARFMEERVGDDFQALVISTTKFGFFVELDELFVEGLVPIDLLPGERWSYRESTRSILAERSRREIRIGDRVEVRLARVDAFDNKLVFTLAPPPDAPRRKPRK